MTNLAVALWRLFQINVGCGTEPTDRYPVRLEYTADGGNTWSLVVPNCAESNLARCFDTTLPPTLYYGGTTAYWRRIVVPLDNMHVCGYVFKTAFLQSSCHLATCLSVGMWVNHQNPWRQSYCTSFTYFMQLQHKCNQLQHGKTINGHMDRTRDMLRIKEKWGSGGGGRGYLKYGLSLRYSNYVLWIWLSCHRPVVAVGVMLMRMIVNLQIAQHPGASHASGSLAERGKRKKKRSRKCCTLKALIHFWTQLCDLISCYRKPVEQRMKPVYYTSFQ